MTSNNPFGLDPDDFERVVRETGENLREAFDTVGKFIDRAGSREGIVSLLDDILGARHARPVPKTGAAANGGVWVIYTVADTGAARIEQAYPTELEALRANKTNTDPSRRVRFLPYGVNAGLLDDTSLEAATLEDAATRGQPGDDPE